MITRLDRYVARCFCSSWVLSLVFFVGLYGVYDFFGNVDDLLDELGGEGDAELAEVGRLYLLQAPGMLLRVAPFVMVMAALVTVLRLQRHNEFMAMVLTGWSARRALRAVLALTVVFVLALVWVQERVAPVVSLERDRLSAYLTDEEEDLVRPRIAMRDFDGRVLVAQGFHVADGLVERLHVSYEDELGRHVSISGEQARWDEEAGGWRLLGGGLSRVQARGAAAPVEGEAVFVATDIRPDDLLAESRGPFDLPYAEILRQSQRYPQSRHYHLLRHYHVTYPLSVLLLVLLALPFVIKPDMGRRMTGLGLSILLCVVFLVVDAFLRDLGSRGYLQPVLAAWLPVIVTGSLVTVLFDAVDR